MSDREVVIVSGVRTAIGGFGGSLKSVPATELAGKVVAAAVDKAGIPADTVDHCVIGNVAHGDRKDFYMARAAAINGGLHVNTPATTVNRLCGSGLQAIVSAAQLILLGDAEAVVAGGAENMSRVPYWVPSARFGARMGDTQMVDAMIGTLTCPIEDYHMGITAENIAEKWAITREEQDAFAVESHQRAERALEAGYFNEQILPIEVKTRKSVEVFKTDEHVRFGASIDGFKTARAAFKKEGTVTAANASGINDAAAALLMMEKQAAEKAGVKPLVKMVAYAFAGVEPKYMGIGPVPAIQSLLAKTGLSVADIDLWEVNEAFAAQALAVVKDLGLPADKVNPNGSGISLGHPIGATGAIITVKAIHELQRIDGRYAVAALCVGGGQGIAALFERC